MAYGTYQYGPGALLVAGAAGHGALAPLAPRAHLAVSRLRQRRPWVCVITCYYKHSQQVKQLYNKPNKPTTFRTKYIFKFLSQFKNHDSHASLPVG